MHLPLNFTSLFRFQLDLVCDRGFLSGLLISTFYAGVLVGGSVTGQAADSFGRRPVGMTALLLTGTLGTAISFTWNFELMLALRFLFGLAIPVSTHMMCRLRPLDGIVAH